MIIKLVGDMAEIMFPRLSYSQTGYDSAQKLSYTNNDLRLPLLSETTRGRPLSSVYALQMEQSGYLELRKYINEKRSHTLFKVILFSLLLQSQVTSQLIGAAIAQWLAGWPCSPRVAGSILTSSGLSDYKPRFSLHSVLTICMQTGTCDTQSGELVFFSAAFGKFSVFMKN